MENVIMTVNDNKLTIEIDLKHRGKLSKSGKTTCVSSTGGFTKIEGTDLKLNLNICEKVV